MKKTILIVGCGDVAQRAIPWLVRRFRVFALIRRPEERTVLRALGARPVVGDLDDRRSLKRLAGVADYVLYAAPPPPEGVVDPRTRRLTGALRRGRSLPQGICYISTTGVYGDCRGVCVAILRAPGIYARERLPLARLTRGDPVLRADQDVFTNHIHADDLARAACLALFRGRPARCYNVVDDTALAMGDYFDLLADHFGLPRPPRVSRAEAAERLSPMTLSFMDESRRLSNARLKGELRMRLAHPTVAGFLATIS